ncbi:hypothetical protein COU89_03690 [Candidatus Roizmanbacteria bacterium CG10_big_fil_rev_8_21_14_0_10_45_7]|uniref:Peptidase C39-like domain-containing protein n=1 Tax=Candidatus Roizmanbacteria bacterium CG10_big_fil_rev_8_21_14_0_10_45_7 TaxID=1974854 RepID=A0A2M8KU10_9BACT|nr:MAG: hypothetical protein COU89_03690 [Candidatus Roizmanbacteria bacterium CG10_big_fil_rev_8_21_14_0_10_45_7]
MPPRPVLFFPNTPDDTHCFQAGLKMILKYFLPDKDYSMEELDVLCAKKEGLYTWASQALLNLHAMGFDIVDIDTFDIDAFMRTGGEYLIKKYGAEMGNIQVRNSDIVQEQRIYGEYSKLGIHQQHLPTITDIKHLLNEGYLACCNVNYYALNGKEGYGGHFVVIYSYDTEGLFLHDPGLPPQPHRKVPYGVFVGV